MISNNLLRYTYYSKVVLQYTIVFCDSYTVVLWWYHYCCASTTPIVHRHRTLTKPLGSGIAGFP
jgi:hypothetical protein